VSQVVCCEVSPDRPVSFAPENWVGAQSLQQLDAHAVALLCFPFAGGAASVFRGWREAAPPFFRPLPVQLPGRENRWDEPPYTQLPLLVATLASVLRPVLRPPFALFGHSMGALVAFELARELRRQGRPGPRRLFVSGCRAPHIPDPHPPLSPLPQHEFLDRLRRLNGIPDEVLRNDDLMKLVMPMLRADFRMCDNYVYRPGQPLDCPISAFAGTEDRITWQPHVTMWRRYTRLTYVERLVPGDHLFVTGAKAALLDAIAADLAPPQFSQEHDHEH
jgi:surfactin synthase thioesterase subunit